jgi:ABC-2 type transport system permease protein
MNRLLRIAAREYVAYVRTVGFWLSMVMMPLGFVVAGMAPQMVSQNSPVPAVVVVDKTGGNYVDAIRAGLARGKGKPAGEIVASPTALPADPAAIGRTLRPWLTGERTLAGKRRLSAVAILHGSGEATAIDLWKANVLDREVETAVRDAVTDGLRRQRLLAAGVDAATLKAADALKPQFTAYSAKAAGKVALRDRLPGIVGFACAMLLWSVIMTGAGILLNSVIEEKSSRVLEVLLASASVPEIMFGKILGVAGVTFTVMGVWASVGAALVTSFAPSIAADVGAVLTSHGLIFYFLLYLVGGYLMYAAIFTAVGAFCETTREAQTLLGPVMLVLIVPIVFLSQAIQHPDSPVLAALSWIPPFTPFLMTARVASEPPWWEILGTGLLMAATVALVVWVAGRAFRAGALSTEKVDFKGLVARLRRAD